jgi:hypothetical protein
VTHPVGLARPTFSVGKLTLFCNLASGARIQAQSIEIINRLKFAVAKAKVLPQLEA